MRLNTRPADSRLRARTPRQLLILLLTLGSLLAVPATTAVADVASLPKPIVIDLVPAFGEVVGAGAVTIGATGLADSAVTTLDLQVDGNAIASQRSGDARAARATGVADLAAGDHLATLRMVDDRGRSATRTWRFTVTDLGVTRLQGPDRISTAVAIARDAYPADGSAGAVVLTRADAFADALAGAPLASLKNAPLLLTASDQLSPGVGDEIRRVAPAGSTVFVLGGQGAISQPVADAVAGMGYTVTRVFGNDRFSTAVEVAKLLDAPTWAFVTSGTSFPDALSASSPAAQKGMPILLTPAGALPDAVRDYLSSTGIQRAFVLGGTKAVAQGTEDAVRAVVPQVDRLAGASRYDTSATIAQWFFDAAKTVAIASGTRFPDALAGARHAALLEAPVLLTTPNDLPVPEVVKIGQYNPERLVVYGGASAVSENVLADARRATIDSGGPVLLKSNPGRGEDVGQVDNLVLDFDRELDLANSMVYVTMNGREVVGRVNQGDFANTLVFQVDTLPFSIVAGKTYAMRMVVLGYANGKWLHADREFSLTKRQLARGDFGSEVSFVQARLTELGYWLGTPDGSYGTLTVQAVMAFEKANGLKRDGVVDDQVRALLTTADRPNPRSTSGRVIEIDLARQIIMVVNNGRAEWTFNTSSGTGEYYTFEGKRAGPAITPTGNFTMFRQIDGLREAPLGKLWRPKYFTNTGIAIHGSTSVPAYPASHGCVRVTYAAMDWIWENNIMPLGSRVLVY